MAQVQRMCVLAQGWVIYGSPDMRNKKYEAISMTSYPILIMENAIDLTRHIPSRKIDT